MQESAKSDTDPDAAPRTRFRTAPVGIGTTQLVRSNSNGADSFLVALRKAASSETVRYSEAVLVGPVAYWNQDRILLPKIIGPKAAMRL